LEETIAKEIDLNNAKDIGITDSNVNITITPNESKTINVQGKETDYISLGIIVALILALAAYFFLTGKAPQTPPPV
jgi:hypothetical protein